MVETKKSASVAKAKQGAAHLRGKGTGQLAGFLTFVREQGVVGLAVGLAIGTAAGATVKVIVDQLINPLVALLTRGVDLNNLKWVLIAENTQASQEEVAIGYGAILSSIIVLLATAFVIYLIIHFAKLDRMDKKKS
jgi:large conductance mechanosensitive channel protein